MRCAELGLFGAPEAPVDLLIPIAEAGSKPFLQNMNDDWDEWDEPNYPWTDWRGWCAVTRLRWPE